MSYPTPPGHRGAISSPGVERLREVHTLRNVHYWRDRRMNDRSAFVVPALAGSGRLKAGPQTFRVWSIPRSPL